MMHHLFPFFIVYGAAGMSLVPQTTDDRQRLSSVVGRPSSVVCCPSEICAQGESTINPYPIHHCLRKDDHALEPLVVCIIDKGAFDFVQPHRAADQSLHLEDAGG